MIHQSVPSDSALGTGIDSRDILEAILELLEPEEGPIAIHAGHFMLLRRGSSCVPSVAEEFEHSEHEDHLPSLIRDCFASFPLATWRLGAALTAALHSRGTPASLLTLVNDWQYVRDAPDQSATAVRQAFYRERTALLPTFLQVLEAYGLDTDCLADIGPHPVFVSEYWLRRQIERRLKRMAKGNGNRELTWQKRDGGGSDLHYDDLDRACRLLVCGQADCAGEVMELVARIHALGCMTLINLIPYECEVPVNEGTRRAIALFGLGSFRAVNVSLPCLGGGATDNGVFRTATIHTVAAERLTSGELTASTDSKRLCGSRRTDDLR